MKIAWNAQWHNIWLLGLPVKPELKDLLKELYTKVADKWEDIGVLLGIMDGQLKAIKSNDGKDSTSCFERNAENLAE